MEYKHIKGVPDFSCKEYREKKNKYCLCIPIINEKLSIPDEVCSIFILYFFKTSSIFKSELGSSLIGYLYIESTEKSFLPAIPVIGEVLCSSKTL